MMHTTEKKQYFSRFCFACGEENQSGIHCKFYELSQKIIVGLFTPTTDHNSYPGRLHGGISATVLDEVIGRAILMEEPETFGVTVELSLKYKKPLPLGEELRCVGWLTRNTRLVFEAEGEILLPNGEVAVTAHGKYMKQPLSTIVGDFSGEKLILRDEETDPKAIDLPDRYNHFFF